ncbi:uncharacterized protein [Macrobrachium rosenbergii]|uniref:uncharacterized protein isoform X1 n=1 Tax=Macrobrachium rosenbergii TaxID=79674 RepID=UPI0034D60B85
MKTSSVAKTLLSSVTVLALLSCACAGEAEKTETSENAVEAAEKSETSEKVENIHSVRLDVPATGAAGTAETLQVLRNYIGSTFAIVGLMFILRELSHGFLMILGPSKKEEQGGMQEGGGAVGAGEEVTESDVTEMLMETTTMPAEMMYDSYSYYNRYDYYYYYPPRGYRSLRNSEPFIARVLNSIDIVESTFSMLDIDEPVCRNRAICEIQRTASAYPLLGDYLKYLRQVVLHIYIFSFFFFWSLWVKRFNEVVD